MKPPAKKARILTVAQRNPIPKLIPVSREYLLEGRVVLAKMKSFAAWPATIQSFRKTCVAVHFFGDNTSGTVPYNCVGLFEENHQLITFNLRKQIRGYEKAVRSAEALLKIPSKYSIFNTL